MTAKAKIRNTLLVAAGMGFGLFSFTGCNSNQSYESTSSGLLYRIINNEAEGDSAAPGKFMKVNVRTVINDSVVKKTEDQWVPVRRSTGRQYDMMEGLALLSKGDSAEFKIPATHIYVQVLDVQDQQGYQAALAKASEHQKEIDAGIIKKYVDSVGAQAKMTDDGVAVIVHQAGEGETVQDGQSVSLMYTGKTLDGTVFDSNQDSSFNHTDPLNFQLGQGRMIPGMESGMKLLKKGAEATLVIPSTLAYGERGRPPHIQPNSVLLFDVKVLDVKDKE